jgi:hypothetical protein
MPNKSIQALYRYIMSDKTIIGACDGRWILIDCDMVLMLSDNIEHAFANVEEVARHELAHVFYKFIIKNDSRALNADSELFADIMEASYNRDVLSLSHQQNDRNTSSGASQKSKNKR